MENLKASKNDVVKQVMIAEIARNFSIGLEKTSAGNFDLRCRCPSVNHKHGRERTSSLYINSRENNFFCYGCNAGSSVIDFYMLCSQKEFLEALNDLKLLVKFPGKYSDVVEKKRECFPLLVQNSEIIRKFLIDNPQSIEDTDGFLQRLDEIIFEKKKDDAKYLTSLNEKMKKKFGER
jgi:DNA primase